MKAVPGRKPDLGWPVLFGLIFWIGLIQVGWAGEGDEMAAALEKIRSRIEEAKFYPGWARRQGIEGTVELLFTLSADGRVQEVRILRSSGSSILDEAAVQVIRRAAPYPIVEDWPGVIRVQLPITYHLK